MLGVRGHGSRSTTLNGDVDLRMAMYEYFVIEICIYHYIGNIDYIMQEIVKNS